MANTPMNPEASSATRDTRVITKACGSRSLDSLRLGVFAMSFGEFTVIFTSPSLLAGPEFSLLISPAMVSGAKDS